MEISAADWKALIKGQDKERDGYLDRIDKLCKQVDKLNFIIEDIVGQIAWESGYETHDLLDEFIDEAEKRWYEHLRAHLRPPGTG